VYVCTRLCVCASEYVRWSVSRCVHLCVFCECLRGCGWVGVSMYSEARGLLGGIEIQTGEAGGDQGVLRPAPAPRCPAPRKAVRHI